MTSEAVLGDGLHRLTGLKKRDYPDGICATVIFGAIPKTMPIIG